MRDRPNSPPPFPNVGTDQDRNLIRALLQPPRAEVLTEETTQRFTSVFSILLLFTIVLTYINVDRRSLLDVTEYTFVSHFPHPASLMLLVGFTLFPQGRRRLFVLSYVTVFALSIALSSVTGTYHYPQAPGTVGFLTASFVFNLGFGVGPALLARAIEPALARSRFKWSLDVSLPTALFGVLISLGTAVTLMITVISVEWMALQEVVELLKLSATQALRLGVFATVCLIFALHPPKLSDLLTGLPIVAVFLGIMLLDKALGWQTERVYTIMFAIFLRFVLPVTQAIPITLFAILAQRLVIPDDTMNMARDDLIFATLLACLTLFDLILLDRLSVEARNNSLRAKLWGSYTFSKYAYFLYSAKLQRFWMDVLAQDPADRSFSDTGPKTLKRMPRKDAEALTKTLGQHAKDPQATVLRLAEGDTWVEGAPYKVYRMHSMSEQSWQYGLVTIGTLTDITDLHETAVQLRDTLKQLEQSKERQHRLFALISHELRTPAALLKMLAEQMNDTGDWAKLGPRFNDTLKQFLTLMDDMGSVVRNEDLLPAAESQFAPNDMLTHLVSVYRPLAEEAGMTIDLRSSQAYHQPRVTDVGRVQQVLGNLMRNAILHSGGRVLTVSYRETAVAGQLWGHWTVSDNGKGIPGALLPGLFDPFNRETTGVFSNSEGTGLGMYIVKLLTENLKGKVSYRAAQGGGSQFQVDLPLTPGKSAPVIAKEAPPQPRAELLPMRVLLVEDNPLVAEITQSQLKRQFTEVSQVSSAEAAIAHAESIGPDLILTDINLPSMNGLNLCRALRQIGVQAPIFGLTAGALDDEIMKEAGAQGLLSKPLSIRKLLHELQLLEVVHFQDVATGSSATNASGEQG